MAEFTYEVRYARPGAGERNCGSVIGGGSTLAETAKNVEKDKTYYIGLGCEIRKVELVEKCPKCGDRGKIQVRAGKYKNCPRCDGKKRELREPEVLSGPTFIYETAPLLEWQRKNGAKFVFIKGWTRDYREHYLLVDTDSGKSEFMVIYDKAVPMRRIFAVDHPEWFPDAFLTKVNSFIEKGKA